MSLQVGDALTNAGNVPRNDGPRRDGYADAPMSDAAPGDQQFLSSGVLTIQSGELCGPQRS